MTKDQFINRVLLVMNEAGMSDQAGSAFIGADSAQVDKHIEGSYVDAWRRVAKVAPRTWLGNKSFKSTIGVVDTFTVSSVGGNTGFTTDTLLYITSIIGEKSIFKVSSVNGDGDVTGVELISSGSRFTVATYQTAILSGTGDLAGDININITAIKSVINDPIPSLSEGTGFILLPSDFYLLTKFKMAGWKVAAMEAAISNSRVANLQSNEYTRGSQLRPAVVINNKEVDGVIRSVLEYYSLQKGLTSHTVEEALYVPVVEELFDKSGDYELGISDQIIAPLVYLSAATVFTIFEKYPVAQALEARAEAMLPGLISLKGTTSTVKQ